MKTTFSTTTRSMTLLLAFVAIFNLGRAQDLKPASNWMQTWQEFAGTQYATNWLVGQMGNEATLYRDAATGDLVLACAMDWNTMAALETGLIEGIQEGNGNQMLATEDAQYLSPTAAMTDWVGQLGGKQLYATAIAQLQSNGQSQLWIRLSAQPMQDIPEQRQQAALALLETLGTDPLARSLVAELK